MQALYPSGRFACDLPVSLSICMLISSSEVHGGPLLSACPRTHCGDASVCLMADRRGLAAAIASASGLD
jgi:hypothetical protein